MPYYFNLPPFDKLTTDQQAAIDETDSIALSGGPGTGKSVVCLWRHIRNYATGSKRSLLLTYTKTLEHYLKQSARAKNKKSAKNINRTFWWLTHNATYYEEIIIDEAQDISKKDHIRLERYSDAISYGADPDQKLYDHGIKPKKLKKIFPLNEEYTMHQNFRNSKEILEFTRSIFPDILIPQNAIDNAKKTKNKPIMIITGWNKSGTVKEIINLINDWGSETHNIGILVPSQNLVNKYFQPISEQLPSDSECTKYHSGMEDFDGLSGVHITTFKSSKGTEFDTVIIPDFDSFDWMIENTKTISEKDYYVAFTRARRNLFLLCKKNPRKGDSGTYEIER